VTPDNRLQAIRSELQTDATTRRAKAGPARFSAVWAKSSANLGEYPSKKSWGGINKLKAIAHRVPVFGPVARFVATSLRLPDRVGQLESERAQLQQAAISLEARLAATTELLNCEAAKLTALTEQVGLYSGTPMQIDNLLHENHLRYQSQLKLLAQLQLVKDEQIKSDSRLETFILRLNSQALPTSLEPGAEATQANQTNSETILLDDFYWRFEEKFRGSTETVRSRLQVYVPYLESVKTSAPGQPLLDIGCGRGEWLKLAQATGLTVKGVDLNAKMVRDCLAAALPVTLGDGVAYLKGEPSNSLAVVTGFHIVEHLPFTLLMTMFKEAYRALAPGGFALFETPNPENILVGACTFYTDPTHKNPIPPPTLAFMLEEAGFIRQECVRLRPESIINPPENAATLAVIQRFYEASDYAIIGFKDGLEL